jgi:hypothetical protein
MAHTFGHAGCACGHSAGAYCQWSPHTGASLGWTLVAAWTLAIGWPAGSCSDQTPCERIGQQALVIVKGHLVNNIIYIVGVIVIIIAILSFFGLR